jgi:hypothetical protein
VGLNKGLAVLLVVVLAAFVAAIILAWSVQLHILDADVYVEALDQTGFFQVPYQMIREGQIPGVAGLLLREGPFSILSGSDQEAVARELAPEDWLRSELTAGIRDLFQVAHSAEVDRMPDLVISLQDVKNRALGEPGQRALLIVLNAIPACAPGEAPVDLTRGTVVCLPPDIDPTAYINEIRLLLVPLVFRLPDTYRVSWQPDQRQALEDLRQTGQTMDRFRSVLLLMLALGVALLAMIWVLAVRSPAELLRWTGGPLLFTGLLVLLLAVLLPTGANAVLDYRSVLNSGDIPAPLSQTLADAVPGLIDQMFRPALFAGGLLALVGLVLTAVSPLFPGRQPRRMAARRRA